MPISYQFKRKIPGNINREMNNFDLSEPLFPLSSLQFQLPSFLHHQALLRLCSQPLLLFQPFHRISQVLLFGFIGGCWSCDFNHGVFLESELPFPPFCLLSSPLLFHLLLSFLALQVPLRKSFQQLHLFNLFFEFLWYSCLVGSVAAGVVISTMVDFWNLNFYQIHNGLRPIET